MFTKQHYEATAKLMRDNKPDDKPFQVGELWLDIMDSFISVFIHDNPHFNKEKFRKACLGG